MGFSRQGYWSGLPFPSPGDLTNPGTEPRSPALQADTLPSEPRGKPQGNLVSERIVGITCTSCFNTIFPREETESWCLCHDHVGRTPLSCHLQLYSPLRPPPSSPSPCSRRAGLSPGFLTWRSMLFPKPDAFGVLAGASPTQLCYGS